LKVENYDFKGIFPLSFTRGDTRGGAFRLIHGL
jgi:hypothetical protein